MNDQRVGRHLAANQRERSSGRLHSVVRRNVVLYQNGNAVKRATNMPSAPFAIEIFGDRYGIWIGFNHRVKQPVQRVNAIEVINQQLLAGQLTGSDLGLKHGNTFFNKIKTACRTSMARQKRSQASA